MGIDHWTSSETAAMGAAYEMTLEKIDGLSKNPGVREGIAKAIIEAARNGESDPNRLSACGLSAVPYLSSQDTRAVIVLSRSPLTDGGGRASRPVSAPRRRAERMVAAE